VPGLIAAGVAACVLSGGAAAVTDAPAVGSQENASGAQLALGAPDAAFETFLDRLMRAESAGRDTAANPRSTALGPFQFIKSTFLAVMRRHFPADVANLSDRDILALRTDRGFARRAAEAFSRDNMDFLADRGLKPTFGHLRLAFLLGPSAAAKVVQAAPSKPVSHILDGSVIVANPFMRRMTAGDLVARATRDVSPKGQPAQQAAPAETQPAVPAPAEQPMRVAEVEPASSTQPERPAQADGAADAVPVPAEQPTRVAEIEPASPTQPERPAQAGGAADAAPAPSAQKERPTAAPAAAPRPTARTAAAPAKRGAGRSAERLVINVTCNERLASCRRWIDEQVAKALRTHTAASDTRSGA
jgi:outer membrane biosynthesis protein TonB